MEKGWQTQMTKRQPGVALVSKVENYLLYQQHSVPRKRATNKAGVCTDLSLPAPDAGRQVLSKEGEGVSKT